MADISKCVNAEKCPIKETCYRYTAKDGMYQSYVFFEYDKEKKECEYYFPIKDKKK